MGSSSDDFNALRALLKLKQHEKPPPRYFDDLSDGIHRRLRGPEGLRRKSLLSLLGFDFGLKPTLVYGLGVSGCAVALYSLVYLLVQDPAAAARDGQAGSAIAQQAPDATASTPHLLTAGMPTTEDSASTNLVLNAEGVNFPVNGFKLRPTPVKYEVPR